MDPITVILPMGVVITVGAWAWHRMTRYVPAQPRQGLPHEAGHATAARAEGSRRGSSCGCAGAGSPRSVRLPGSGRPCRCGSASATRSSTP